VPSSLLAFLLAGAVTATYKYKKNTNSARTNGSGGACTMGSVRVGTTHKRLELPSYP
jgi:hypothetical protein